MKTLLLMFVLTTSIIAADAGWLRAPVNYRYPAQEVFDRTTIVPGASSASSVLSAHAGATSATPVTVTSFVANPDYPRNLIVTPGGSTGDVKAGDVVNTGKTNAGATISETFTFLDNASTGIVGTKAFATITSILFPAEDAPYAATWSVGRGDKIGLTHCLDGAGWFDRGLVDNVALTGYTLATDATHIEANTLLPDPVANGTRQFNFLYIQNFRCR